MLVDRLERYDVPVWLVNTGWTGGSFGTGHRMNIAHTRAMVGAAISGDLDSVKYRTDPIFGLAVPRACPNVPPEVLDPRATWQDPKAYDEKARHLAGLFRENFDSFDGVDSQVRNAGPK